MARTGRRSQRDVQTQLFMGVIKLFPTKPIREKQLGFMGQKLTAYALSRCT